MTDTLKHCPFCGHPAGIDFNESSSRYWVACSYCEASSGKCKSRDEAINDWNTRYSDSSSLETYSLTDSDADAQPLVKTCSACGGKPEIYTTQIRRKTHYIAECSICGYNSCIKDNLGDCLQTWNMLNE